MATAFSFLCIGLGLLLFGLLASRPSAQDPTRVFSAEANRRVAKPFVRVGALWTSASAVALIATWLLR